MKNVLLIVFLLLLFLPREARVSGSAVGTITEKYFEVSGDDGLRKHFADSADEYEYHKEERAKIAKALRPLADKIKALVERLMKKKPWSELIQAYDRSADPGPDVNLKQFESPEFGPYIKKLQDRGPYRYSTGFMHNPGDSLPLRTTVRFLFKGPVEPELLYELEDGIYALRDTAPEDKRYTANKSGVKLRTDSCDDKKKLEKIRQQVLLHTDQEVPYHSAVEIIAFEGDPVEVHAVIYVERDSQKGILIGKGGKKLKAIGAGARKAIERLLGQRVYLDLRVKVKKGWSRSAAGLRSVGYEES